MANLLKQKRHVMAEKWKHPKTPIALNDCEGQSTDRVLTWRHSRTAKSDRSRSSSSENERLIMNIFFSHFFALFGARVHFVRNVTTSKKKEKLPLTPLVSPAPLSTSDELQRPCVHIHRLILGFSFHCWWRTNASQFFFFISTNFYLPQATTSTFEKINYSANLFANFVTMHINR